MEDYSPSPDEVEETPLKRRRFLRGNFLRSWLDHRRDDGESEPKSKTSKSESNDNREDIDWRPERLRDRLRNIFRDLVNLEAIPAAEGLEKLAKIPLVETPEHESVEETPDIESVPDQEEGLLAVSADAQRRYYGYELLDEPGLPKQEEEPEVDQTETEEPIEHQLPTVPIETQNQAAKLVENRPTTPVEPVGEVLRRRQAEHLERKVKQLKQQAKTAKREQAEVVDKQKDF